MKKLILSVLAASLVVAIAPAALAATSSQDPKGNQFTTPDMSDAYNKLAIWGYTATGQALTTPNATEPLGLLNTSVKVGTTVGADSIRPVSSGSGTPATLAAYTPQGFIAGDLTTNVVEVNVIFMGLSASATGRVQVGGTSATILAGNGAVATSVFPRVEIRNLAAVSGTTSIWVGADEPNIKAFLSWRTAPRYR